jgi:hypothetical protein
LFGCTLYLRYPLFFNTATAAYAPGFNPPEDMKAEWKQEVKAELKEELRQRSDDKLQTIIEILREAKVGRRPHSSGSEGSGTESEGSDTSLAGRKARPNSREDDDSIL